MSITNEPLSEMKFDMEVYCKHGYTFCVNVVCKLTSMRYPLCEMFNLQSIHNAYETSNKFYKIKIKYNNNNNDNRCIKLHIYSLRKYPI